MAEVLTPKFGRTCVMRIRHEGPLVSVDIGKTTRVMQLSPEEALNMASALTRAAFKAERKAKGLLPNKKDVDQFEEGICGKPTIIQTVALSAGEIARGKPYEL